MGERIDKAEFVRLVAQRVQRDEDTVGEIVAAAFEEIDQAMKRGESVPLRVRLLQCPTGARELGLQAQPVAAPARAVRLLIQRSRQAVRMATFERRYPRTTRWVKKHLWIQLGDDGMSRSWLRALDEGGLIWDGGDFPSQTLDEAFAELDAALAAWMREQFGARTPWCHAQLAASYLP